MRTPATYVLAVVAAALTAAGAQVPRDALPAQPGTASISGTVVSDPDGSPLRRATVGLSGSVVEPGRTTLTDEAGKFFFADIPAGNVTLMAHKPAYVPTFFGQKRPGKGSGVVLSLAAGQQMNDIVVRVPKGSVITGIIRDESGALRRNLAVLIQGVRVINGERRLTNARSPVMGEFSEPTTDDRGVFRAYGLPPGEYVVSASLPVLGDLGPRGDLRRMTPQEWQWASGQLRGRGPAPGRTGLPGSRPETPPSPTGQRIGSARVYFPGTTDPSAAAVVTIGLGEERAGVDFVVTYVPMARISGTLLGPDGQPVAGTVSVPVAMGAVRGSSTPSARSGGDGRFSMGNLPPGSHRLVARTGVAAGRGGAMGSGPADLWALTEIVVNGEDLTGITLNLQRGLTLDGRVVFDSTATPPRPLPSAVRVTAIRGDEFGAGATTNPDGTFQVTGLMPGRYRLTASAVGARGQGPAAGWVLKSASIGERDVADIPFEITSGSAITDAVVVLSDLTGEISGTLFDAAGRPTPDYFVVVFSTNRDHWLEGSRRLRPPVRPSSSGTYRVSPLPAGTYYLAALTDVDQEDLYDKDFLEQVAAGALTITLGDGEKKVQDVKLAGR